MLLAAVTETRGLDCLHVDSGLVWCLADIAPQKQTTKKKTKSTAGSVKQRHSSKENSFEEIAPVRVWPLLHHAHPACVSASIVRISHGLPLILPFPLTGLVATLNTDYDASSPPTKGSTSRVVTAHSSTRPTHCALHLHQHEDDAIKHGEVAGRVVVASHV